MRCNTRVTKTPVAISWMLTSRRQCCTSWHWIMFNRRSNLVGPAQSILMGTMQRTTVAGLVVASCLVTASIAETRKEFHYTVGTKEKANVSVDTTYGGITVKPGPGN